jgi:hypothetical protein
LFIIRNKEEYGNQRNTIKRSSRIQEISIEGLIEDEANFRISPDDEKEAPFPTLDMVDSFTLGAFEDHHLAELLVFKEKERIERN